MSEFDGVQFGREIVAEIKNYTAPMLAKIKELEAEAAELKLEVAELKAREPLRGEKGEPGQQGEPGAPGADGVGLASSFIDQGGNLVLTFTDGTVGSVGRVVGDAGKDADPKEIKRIIIEEIAKIPKPQDGKDGKDGLGFDDLTEELSEDGRWLIRHYVCGERKKEFMHPIFRIKYCGVWKHGNEYGLGDFVTYGGSMWHADKLTKNKPGTCEDWTLAIRKGIDGRNGERGPVGEKGAPGRDGRDLTQMAPDGTKW